MQKCAEKADSELQSFLEESKWIVSGSLVVVFERKSVGTKHEDCCGSPPDELNNAQIVFCHRRAILSISCLERIQREKQVASSYPAISLVYIPFFKLPIVQNF